MVWDAALDERCRALIGHLLSAEVEERQRPIWFALVGAMGPHLQAFAVNSRVLRGAGLRDTQHSTDLVARVTESMRQKRYANLAQFSAKFEGTLVSVSTPATTARSAPVELTDNDAPDDEQFPEQPDDPDYILLANFDDREENPVAAAEEPLGTPFRGWVLRLMHYRALDHVRHVIRAARRDQKAAEAQSIQSTLRSRAAQDDGFKQLLSEYEALVRSLPSIDRRVLALYGQNLKRDEIATAVRRTPATVSNIRSRAIKKLRRCVAALRERGDDDE